VTPWKKELIASFPPREAERIYQLDFAGRDGFLTTDEKVPAGFFEELAATFRPDGYLVGAAAGRYSYGAGCGHALALLEAFPATPKGVVLADPDPAVVRGLNALVEEGFPARGEGQVRRAIVRNQARLHELARAGAIAVVQASILDPEFLAAVSRLPGFGQTANVLYLANVADHEVRRLLFAGARSRLGIARGNGHPRPGSTPGLLAHVNADLARLELLARASGRAVFVHTSETDDLVLAASAEPPRYRADGFFLQIDLDRMIQGLFEAPAAPGSPWHGAAAFQKMAHALFGAAARRDRDRVESALERLAHEVEDLPLAAGGDRAFTAFRLAELGEGLALARQAFPGLLSPLMEEIRSAAGQLETAPGTVAAPEAFLLAHAYAVLGTLLGDPGLGELAERLAAEGLASRRPEGEPLGLRVEALLRLLRCQIHRPVDAVAVAVRQGVAELLASGMTANAPNTTVPLSGYESHALSEGVISSNTRLLLFFQGLAEESLTPIRAALS
jgi:hypothetical protein